MFRNVEKILICDLELTCWEDEKPPNNERPEIIQIGYAYLDIPTLKVEGKGHLFVKPVYSKVSEFCTQLTGVTPKMAKSGMTLDSACKNMIRQLGSRRYAWASWGSGDMECFKKECEIFDAEYPFCEQYLDVQALYALAYNQPVRTGQKKALEALQIAPHGREHWGPDDAYNAAQVLGTILRASRPKEEINEQKD